MAVRPAVSRELEDLFSKTAGCAADRDAFLIAALDILMHNISNVEDARIRSLHKAIKNRSLSGHILAPGSTFLTVVLAVKSVSLLSEINPFYEIYRKTPKVFWSRFEFNSDVTQESPNTASFAFSLLTAMSGPSTLLRMFASVVLYDLNKAISKAKRSPSATKALLDLIASERGTIKAGDPESKSLNDFIHGGSRYRLVANKLEGLGSLFFLPEKVPCSAWERHFTEKSGYLNQATNHLKDLGICDKAKALKAHKCAEDIVAVITEAYKGKLVATVKGARHDFVSFTHKRPRASNYDTSTIINDKPCKRQKTCISALEKDGSGIALVSQDVNSLAPASHLQDVNSNVPASPLGIEIPHDGTKALLTLPNGQFRPTDRQRSYSSDNTSQNLLPVSAEQPHTNLLAPSDVSAKVRSADVGSQHGNKSGRQLKDGSLNNGQAIEEHSTALDTPLSENDGPESTSISSPLSRATTQVTQLGLGTLLSNTSVATHSHANMINNSSPQHTMRDEQSLDTLLHAIQHENNTLDGLSTDKGENTTYTDSDQWGYVIPDPYSANIDGQWGYERADPYEQT